MGIVGKFWIQLGQWEHPTYPMLFVIFFPFTAINFIIEALGPTQWNIWDQWGIWRFIGLKRGFIGNSGDLVVTVGVQWEHCKPIPVMKMGFSLCSISHREKPVFITWELCIENRFFPVWKYYTGKTLFWPCIGPV